MNQNSSTLRRYLYKDFKIQMMISIEVVLQQTDVFCPKGANAGRAQEGRGYFYGDHHLNFKIFVKLVGLTGFEPATSTTPRLRATRLRHSPTLRRTDRHLKVVLVLSIILQFRK